MARIIFIPGKNPKPPAQVHRHELRRCLLEGVRRVNHQVAASLEAQPDVFELVAWNHDYYGRHSELGRDLPWIDALLKKHGPTAEDILEAETWNRRFTAACYQVADVMPWLIRWVANAEARNTIDETHRYFANQRGAADRIHRLGMSALLPPLKRNEPVLLIGHSLGSVIAWNLLWLLTHRENCRYDVDHFLSLGSPLGMRFVQRRLLGHDQAGTARYPRQLRKWTNIAAVGDLTALDETVKDDFHEMLSLGLVEEINEAHGRIYNYYRDDKGLNSHRSYGYLVNPVVGQVISSWWYRHGMKG